MTVLLFMPNAGHNSVEKQKQNNPGQSQRNHKNEEYPLKIRFVQGHVGKCRMKIRTYHGPQRTPALVLCHHYKEHITTILIINIEDRIMWEEESALDKKILAID